MSVSDAIDRVVQARSGATLAQADWLALRDKGHARRVKVAAFPAPAVYKWQLTARGQKFADDVINLRRAQVKQKSAELAAFRHSLAYRDD